ncbi:MAG: histidine kinase [Hyphomonas sp.]|nr:histidine kinase [Hyphomonas sp.]
MSQTDATAQSEPGSEPSSERDSARLKWTIAAIILLMAGALGLKAWDERQTADQASLSRLQAEARAIAASLTGHADTAEMAIRLIADTGASRSAVARATPGVDAVVTLTDADAAPDGSRLKEAARTGEALLKEGRRIGLSEQGDIVVISETGKGASVLALAPVGTWLPPVSSAGRLTLIDGAQRAGNGQEALAPPGAETGFTSLGRLDRLATGCAPVDGAGLMLCTSRQAPLFTLDDLIRILIFGLLLAAPVLAITGLMTRLTHREEEVIMDEVRDDEVNRIMNIVMHGARAGYWEWSHESNAVYLSDGASELMGMRGHGELSIEDLLQQVHPEHRDRIREAFRKGQEIGWVQAHFMTSFHPARWMELRGSVTEISDDHTRVFGGIILDITERRQSEDRVKAAERRLRGAIEGFNGPFALWDHRRRLLYWNRAFALDFGLEGTLRAGMGHDTVMIARAGALRSDQPSETDPQTTLVALNDGRWQKMVERPTADAGLISVGVDVTENVRNEEELKRQKAQMRKTALELERSEGRASELSRKYSEEKAKAEHAAHTKSAFLANMSHELRTPLNAINGFSEIISNELYGPLGDERYKGYAQDILTSGQHLLDMINDILDMAKIEAGKMTIDPQPIDPVDPVDAAVRMIRRKAEDKEIELVLDTQPHLPEIDADHRAIRQMVLNLVSNAIKFTDAGGKITVCVEQRGPDIYVGVTDTGIGIPAEDLPRLATPFEQVTGSKDRNYEGTGLGLALTKSFAEMHGGRMILSSIEGEGTTVAFTLPISGLPDDMEEDTRDVA